MMFACKPSRRVRSGPGGLVGADGPTITAFLIFLYASDPEYCDYGSQGRKRIAAHVEDRG
jgi:hypothetical protein